MYHKNGGSPFSSLGITSRRALRSPVITITSCVEISRGIQVFYIHGPTMIYRQMQKDGRLYFQAICTVSCSHTTLCSLGTGGLGFPIRRRSPVLISQRFTSSSSSTSRIWSSRASFDRPEHQTFYGSLKAEVRGREGICCSSRSAAGIYLYVLA